MVDGFRFFWACWALLLTAAPANLAADLGGVDFLAGGAALAGFSLAGAIRPDFAAAAAFFRPAAAASESLPDVSLKIFLEISHFSIFKKKNVKKHHS